MQVLRSTPVTLEVTFYSDGEIVDPGDVTVAVVLPDGTALDPVPDVSGTGAVVRTATVPAASTGELGRCTATWTSADLGTVETEFEIVGAHLFTVAAARTWGNAALADSDAYPTTAIEQKRQDISEEFEGICGVSFIPRGETVTLDGRAQWSLMLPHLKILSLVSVETWDADAEEWTAFDDDALDDLVVETWGQVTRRSDIWPRGRRNVRIRYEHGFERVPGPIREVALRWCRYSLVPTNINERAISVSNQNGSEQLWTPGYSGRGKAIHPLPEVDRVLRMPAYNFRIGGMA